LGVMQVVVVSVYVVSSPTPPPTATGGSVTVAPYLWGDSVASLVALLPPRPAPTEAGSDGAGAGM
jgi:hypothetical protein